MPRNIKERKRLLDFEIDKFANSINTGIRKDFSETKKLLNSTEKRHRSIGERFFLKSVANQDIDRHNQEMIDREIALRGIEGKINNSPRESFHLPLLQRKK